MVNCVLIGTVLNDVFGGCEDDGIVDAEDDGGDGDDGEDIPVERLLDVGKEAELPIDDDSVEGESLCVDGFVTAVLLIVNKSLEEAEVDSIVVVIGLRVDVTVLGEDVVGIVVEVVDSIVVVIGLSVDVTVLGDDVVGINVEVVDDDVYDVVSEVFVEIPAVGFEEGSVDVDIDVDNRAEENLAVVDADVGFDLDVEGIAAVVAADSVFDDEFVDLKVDIVSVEGDVDDSVANEDTVEEE